MKRSFENAKGTHHSLSEEITRKFEHLRKECKEKVESKQSWVSELQEIVRRELSESFLVMIGSSVNMFGFKENDCDLTVVTGKRVFYSVTALEKIERLLPKSKFSTELARGAKVPVLKIKDKENSLEADINVDCLRNIRHTYLVRCYALLDARVQPLGLVIKLWAKNARIIDQRGHKLSGFTLLLLFIYYLQVGCSPPVVPMLQSDYPSLFSDTVSISVLVDRLKSEELPLELQDFQSSNKQTLGELFVGFFRFYANFGWSKVVSIRRIGGFVSNSRPYMKIEDPYEFGGNCARGIYNWTGFAAIKNAFSSASRKLDDNLTLTSLL